MGLMKIDVVLIKHQFGAERGNRTPMMSPSRDFESRASTNSAISAYIYEP